MPAKKTKTFEENLGRLEEIVALLAPPIQALLVP